MHHSLSRIPIITVLTLIFACAFATAGKDSRIVQPPAYLDTNNDRISDRLQQRIANGSFERVGPPQEAFADVLVALDHAPAQSDHSRIRGIKGQVTSEWNDLVYAVRVNIPVQAITQLAHIPGVVFVEENERCKKTMWFSTRQTRARTVWNMGFEGNSDHTIAVLDTGVDDSHPDLAGKVIAWIDYSGVNASVSGDEYLTPTDKGEHGTHVSGIIAGTGAASGISSGIGSLPITQSLYFPNQSGSGYLQYFPVDTTGASGNSTITSRLKWHYTADSTRSNGLQIWYNTSAMATGTQLINGSQPLVVSYSGVSANTVSLAWSNLPYTGKTGNNTAYWIQASAPLAAAGDGKNLNRGIAPGCRIAGVKVLDDTGSGTSSQLLDGLTWVQNNRATYNIVAANMSLSFSSVVSTIDTAVNNLVASGVVCVAASGNGRGTGLPYTYSPATASKCIAVAAISDAEKVTNYSSYGSSGASKPDVAAPGGSSVTRRSVVSADTNDVDLNYNPQNGTEAQFPDAFSNDYQGMNGTSMAAPHVSGLVGLLANALGTWSFTESNALRAKMLIGMTACETNTTAESAPNPGLERGAKDTSEGFGRVNADALVEAAALNYEIGTPASVTLGSGTFDKKVWARKVNLFSSVPYTFTITNPVGADYDLYLYRDTYTTTGTVSNASAGDPIIAAQSTSGASGGTETINYTPTATGSFYLVVKRISGAGAFSLISSTGGTIFTSPANFVSAGWNLVSLPATPLNGDPLLVLSGVDVPNSSLQYWRNDTEGGGYQSYGTVFGWTGPMQVGLPYWFLHTGASKTLSFPGTTNTSNWQINIAPHASAPYWIMLGHPFNHNTYCTDIRFSNAGNPTPVPWATAYSLGIVESAAQGYNPYTHGFFTVGPSDFIVERNRFEPWYGYWLLVRQPGSIMITIPVSPVAP